MPSAVIQFDFDPVLRLGDRLVRLETIGIALAILAGLVVAALVAGRTSADATAGPRNGATAGARAQVEAAPAMAGGPPPEDARPPGEPSPGHQGATLRRDDLLFIALGILPGAIVGARLGWALASTEYVLARPAVLIDPGVGALTLGGAVLGGTLTGVYVAALLEAPVGRWLDALIGPILLMLALGKLAMLLGGSGQGAPFDGQSATAFGGPGPWGSVAPGVPAHPAQVYEALADVAVLMFVVLLSFLPIYRRHRDGRLFWTGIGIWALARTAVASTWRDPAGWWGLGSEQLIGLATAALALSFLVVLVIRAWRRGRRMAPAGRAA